MPAKTVLEKDQPQKQSKPKKTTPPAVPAAQRGLGAFAPELANGAEAAPAQIVRIPVKDVDIPNALNATPLDDANVEGIAATARIDGLHYPIEVKARVVNVNVDDRAPAPLTRYELVDGRHRLEAARRLGWTEIPAVVRQDLDDASTRVARVVMNLQRRVVAPYEEACGFKELQDQGLTQAEIAERCGVSVATVATRLKLLDLPEDLAKRVGESGFTQKHAEVILPLAKHPKLLETATAHLGAKTHRDEPVDADEFERQVLGTLAYGWGGAAKRALVNLGNHEFEAVGKTKAFKDLVAPLPKVKLGRGEFVVDEEGVLRKALAEYAAKKETERKGAGGRKVDDAEKKRRAAERRRRELEAATAQRMHDVLAKAVQRTTSIGGREIRLMVRELFERVTPHETQEAIANMTGITLKDVVAALKTDATATAFIDTLARKKDQAPLARLAMALCVTSDMYARGNVPDYLLKTLAGVDRASLEKAARKDLDAARKTKPKKRAARSTSEAKADEGQDADDVEDQDADGGDDE